jgi:ankyrin repeat protein
MTEFLLLKDANIDARTIGENQTPIHYAAKNGATKSLRVLLGYNADINSLDSKQRTPLQVRIAGSIFKLKETENQSPA